MGSDSPRLGRKRLLVVRLIAQHQHAVAEIMKIDGAHASQLLFTPSINQDIHAIFLQQIAASDPDSLHVVIADLAGFHLRVGNVRIPATCGFRRCPRIPRNSIRWRDSV
jgi:hypothetical protein